MGRRMLEFYDVDRTPKPCRHPLADHRHGTRACYTHDDCRCLPCAQACTDYEQNRIRQHAYGRWDNFVDAGPAREHVKELRRRGMGRRTLSLQAGVAESTITNLTVGKVRKDGSYTLSRRIRKEVADKLLKVTFELAEGSLTSALGSTRRIRALIALGWSQYRLALELGYVSQTLVTELALAKNPTFTVRNARAVSALYERLSMTLPPNETPGDKASASRSRNYAKKRGWLPPLAWDDELLDEADAQPLTASEPVDELDESAVLRRLNGDRKVQLTKAEQAEVVRRLLAAGTADKDIERRTGINSRRALPLSERRAS